VVVGDGAWVVDAEGVEGVGEGEEGVFERVGCVREGEGWEGDGVDVLAGCGGEEGEGFCGRWGGKS
jgi:hypothetical protein